MKFDWLTIIYQIIC